MLLCGIMNEVLSFQTSNLTKFCVVKNKKTKTKKRARQNRAAPCLPSNLPLLSLLSPLSQNVVEIRTTSRFSPQQVGSASSFDLQIYIPQHIYSSHIIFQQSLLISRAFIFREYAHTNRRKDGHDDQQQQRGDDDDDDEKKSSSHVLSIWRKIFCFQCEQRVESSSGEQKNEQSKYHNESIRSRRYHHRRRRVVRERSVAIGDSGLNRFLGHVVWAVQVNQQSGGESGAGV